jgi:hypothetical protein
VGFFYFLLGLGGLLILSLVLSLRRRFGRRGRLPFVVDEALFSPSQRDFMAVLERAIGQDYRVFGRVRAAEVIGLRPRLDRATRRRAYALIGDRQFDFLICAATTGSIVCAVNLAPRSRLGRPPSRNTLDRICTAAGLPFVCLREADSYREAEVARCVQEAIHVLRPPVRPVAEALRQPPGEARYSLMEVTIDDAREPRLIPSRVRSDPPAPATGLVSPMPHVAPAESVPRREPTLAVPGDLDLGPAFHIDGGMELEEDRPVRVRWA